MSRAIQRTLEEFGALLRDEVVPETMADELRAAVGHTMQQPARIALWLRGGAR